MNINNIEGKVALITGAAGGIGRALALELSERSVKTLALVDRSKTVIDLCNVVNELHDRTLAVPYCGDVTDPVFRRAVYAEMSVQHGLPTICVPAAGITLDELAVKTDKQTGEVLVYPIEKFRTVTEVNLIAPVYWAMEMVAGIAQSRKKLGLGRWEPHEEIQGNVIFIGSVSSLGNKGQIAYAAAKAGLEGATATLFMEAIYHGVRCGIIHPGYTDTPMVRALGDAVIRERIIPRTSLKRLIHPAEIADAICFMISNSAVSGSLWADAGYRPAA
jgi:NAD(P)-dependent dehydrogenase (short-subunit alcohol dehydrogenase family)